MPTTYLPQGRARALPAPEVRPDPAQWVMSDDFAETLRMLPGAPETRAMDVDAYFREVMAGEDGGITSSGLYLGPMQKLRVATVFACRRVIAEDVAQMPRQVVRRTRTAKGKLETQVQHKHPLNEMLVLRPNDWMTSFEFFEHLVAAATTHRGGYAWIVRGQYDPGDDYMAGTEQEVLELLPLLPGAVSVWQDGSNGWDAVYQVSGYGTTFHAGKHDLIKLHGPMDDRGLAGFAVNSIAADAIGLASAIEGATMRFHKNDLRPSGALISKGKLSPAQVDNMKATWADNFGPGGKGGIAVLDGDFDFKAFNATSADSQSLENRKFQIEEICRYFRVPTPVIGHNSGTQAYGTIEQQLSWYVNQCLRPWSIRLQQALTISLLTDEECAGGLVIDVDADAVGHGTFSDRVTAYANGVKVFLTPNEVREKEGLDRIDQPGMDMVQLGMNNTGISPHGEPTGGAGKPITGQASGQAPAKPAATQTIGAKPDPNAPQQPQPEVST